MARERGTTPHWETSETEESLELYRSLVRASPDAVTATDLEGRITAVSARTLEMYGGDREEDLIGRSALELIVPEEHATALENLGITLRSGVVGPVEYTMVRRDGSKFIGSLSAALVRDRAGMPRAFVATTRDVTDAKSAQIALEESEARYRTLIELSPDPVVILADGRYRFASPAFTRLFGYTQEDIAAGLHFTALVPAHELAGVSARYAARMAGEDLSTTYRVDLLTRDGRLVPCETSARLIQYEGEPADLVIIRDVTEREAAEERHRRLEARVLQSQKLESLGLLAGGVAHDFNNLLAAILGNLDLLRRELPVSAAGQRLDTVETAALRASEICNQLLEYAGRRPGHLEPVDLTPLVEETIGLVVAGTSTQTLVHRELGRGLPAILGNATQLRQAVMNLLTNASDAVGARGEVSVSTGITHCDSTFLEEEALVSHSTAGPHVYVEIADRGAGMDEQTLQRIFDPFFTTKSTGRGLGLTTVQSCLASHHGVLWVRTAKGRGTTLRMMLPVAEAHSTSAREETSGQGSAGAILVVDDEPLVRNVIEALLRSEGYLVVSASNGTEAVAAFGARPTEFAALVVDMIMPDMNGADVLERVRQLRPDVPVLLTSGYHEQDIFRLVGDAQAVSFLQKPFRSQGLLDSLTRLLGLDEPT